MPSKQFLMDNYASAGAILDYAVEEHDVDSVINFVQQSAGQLTVQCKLVSNPSHTFNGVGATKKEAMADCISAEFPA